MLLTAAVVAVYTSVAARLFLKREEVWLYIVLPPERHPMYCTSRDYVFVPTKYFLYGVGGQETWQHQHEYTQMHRRWLSQKEELDVRLLLYRGRHQIESLRA